MAKRTYLILLTMVAFLISLYPFDIEYMQPSVSHAQSPDNLQRQFEPYVEYLNEFTERRRLKVYFANEQSIFYGAQVGYVNVGIGNVTFIRRDLVTVGRLPLVMARVYDSNLNNGDDFGRGWHMSVAETIKVEADGSLVMMTESAMPLRFIRAGNGFTHAKPCPTDIVDILQTDRRRFQVEMRTGFLKEYTLIGDLYRLTRIQDKNRNSVVLKYQGSRLSQIQGENERQINIDRDTIGRIVSIRDDNGRSVGYKYNENGQLTKVIDLGGNPWRYEYNESGQLDKAVNPFGNIDLALAYDEHGLVTELVGPGFDYRFRYQEQMRRTIVTDGNGFVSEYVQNKDGITTTIINALGVKSTLLLDERNLVQKLSRNGILQAEMEYDSSRRLASLVKYESRTPTRINYVYDTVGRLTQVRNGLDITTLRYDERGNLLERANQDGWIRYTYSSKGDPTTTNFGNAIILHFEFDNDGQITSVKDKLNRRTRFEYYNDGKLSRVDFADGSKRIYRYNRLGMRLLRQLDGKARVDYTYNAAGSMSEIQIENPDGTNNGQRLTIDEEQKVRVIEGVTGIRSYLNYDRMGNLTAVITGNQILRFNYDRFNRLTEVIKPSGERLSYTYADGEPDLRLQMDYHTKQTFSERINSGLTFSSGLELLRNRTEGSLFGVVRFDRAMSDYRLLSKSGVVLPDEVQNSAILRMRMITLDGSTYKYKNSFDAPSNIMFIPAEYWALNCCPICPPPSGDPFIEPICESCNPDPPPPGEIVELYYKYSSFRIFLGPGDVPMKECIYVNCPGNNGKPCFSNSGFSDFRPANSPCPAGILLVSERIFNFIIEYCRTINHYDFLGPFSCP